MTGGRRAALDDAAWMERALATLALRLRHEVAVTRVLRGPDRQDGFLGLFVTDDEAEAILAEVSGRLRVSGTAASASEIDALEDELAVSRLADPAGVWARLADRFDLAAAELDLLLLAAAPAVDPRLGRVYGYLNDDVARRHLTLALATRLLDRHGLDAATLRRMLAPDAPLLVAGLLEVGPERPLVEAPLRVDDELLDRLLGEQGLPPAVAACWERLPVPPGRGPVTPAVWVVDTGTGRDGAGTALALAGALGRDVALLDADRTTADRSRTATVSACLREARLVGALPVLVGFDGCTTAERQQVVARLLPPAVVLTRTPVAWEDAGVRPARLPVATPPRAESVATVLRGHPADAPELRAWLGRLGHLDLLVLARLLVHHRDADELRAAVRARMAMGLTGLAQHVPAQFELDDLVLPRRAQVALQGLVASQSTSATVLDRWGLGPVFGKRPSTIALFKGPSGTGKTMAASATAHALDLPLFRVDLASLVSKYIGETEKNLDRLFTAAEAADVVLLFDEADALFGRRSEVQDAHDRYANLETSYLLQRLEAHSGIAILASNLHQNIDEAFVRRLDLVVEFPAPRPAARRAIWRRIGLTSAPLDADVDLDALAESFELTGGEIRNVWLAAAHAAAAHGGTIDRSGVVQAVGRELVKAGKPVRRSAFGADYAALRVDEDRG